MAKRPPLVRVNGVTKELPAGDTLGIHAKFTGTSTTAFAIGLGATQTMLLTVAPVITGDVLAAGEDISLQPNSALPQGINMAWYFVSAQNQVSIGFTSSSLINVAQSISWRVTAQR
jgi:hypothetical protein